MLAELLRRETQLSATNAVATEPLLAADGSAQLEVAPTPQLAEVV